MRPFGLLILLILVITSGGFTPIRSTELLSPKSQERERAIPSVENSRLAGPSFSQLLSESLSYFRSFEFQSYRSFADQEIRQRGLYAQALTQFYSDLKLTTLELGLTKLSDSFDAFPTPGQNVEFDRIYAKALTSHYISPQGLLVMSVRDGFQPMSIYHLLTAGLVKDPFLDWRLRRQVQSQRELSLFFLKARYVATKYFAFYPVHRSSQAMSLWSSTSWSLDLSAMDETGRLSRLESLLEAAISVRGTLDALGQSLPKVYVMNPWKKWVPLSRILPRVKVTGLAGRFSPHPEHSFYRLMNLFSTLQRPLL